jgi:cell division protein FtsL
MKRFMENLNLPMLLIFLGAILSAIGTIYATIKQNQEKLQSATQKAEFERELRLKTEEIAELNKNIAETLTGGNSYCYLLITYPQFRRDVANLTLMHEGKYPLYDVQIKIDDVEEKIRIMKEEWENGKFGQRTLADSETVFAQASKVFKIGNFGPNQVMNVTQITLPSVETKGYNIDITARNGYIAQTIRFRNFNGQWKLAEKLVVHGKVFKEEIPIEFPRDRNGNFAW